MSRTLSTGVLDQVDDTTTHPYFLVFLDFAVASYLSTRQAVTWNSQAWAASGVNVISVTPGGTNNAASAVISLPNLDNSAAAIVLNEDIADKAAKIYVAYGNGDPGASDPVLIFDGVMDAATDIADDRVVIALAEIGTSGAWVPTVVLAPPLLNHMPPPATVITWGTERYVLEGR